MLRIHTWGDPHSAKKALILHGLASTGLAWKQFASALVEEGWVVYAPDLPGHGGSAKEDAYDVSSLADKVYAALGHAGVDRVNLVVGHSLGGMVAASVHERLHADKLMLVDPVFHLPKHRLLLGGIRIGFKEATLRTVALKKRVYSSENWRAEAFALRGWDKTTAKALTPDKKLMIKCLLSDSEVLLVRAKGSFVAPHRLQKRKLGAKVQVRTLSGGHNLHFNNSKGLVSMLKEFLTPASLASNPS